MGKLLVTNCDSWEEQLRGCFEHFGKTESYHNKNVTAYKKECIEHENHYESEDGAEYVICTGTWVYEDLIGEKALERVLSDYKVNHSIECIRGKLVGTYALVIKTGESIVICTDRTHTYALYYHIDNERFIVTNTFYHIQKVTNQQIDEDAFCVLASKRGFHSGKTPFAGIFRLMGNEALVYENGCPRVIEQGAAEALSSFRTAEEVVDNLQDSLINVMRSFQRLSKKRFLFVTGGKDSRLFLSLDHYLGNNIEIGYWRGGDCVTNGTESDIEVNKLISEELSIESHLIDVTEDIEKCLGELDVEECDKYGEYAYVYGHNKKWLELFREVGKYSDFVEFGYGPEAIEDNIGIDVSYSKPYSTYDLAKAMFMRSGLFDHVVEKEGIEQLLINDCSSYLDNIDIEDLDIDEADRLFNYLRLDTDCIISNYANEYMYSCPWMFINEVWNTVISIPYNIKENSTIPIRIIENTTPQLNRIKYYSHNHYMKFDEKNLCLKRTNIHKALSRIKPIVLHTKLFKLYRATLEEKVFPELGNADDVQDACIAALRQGNLHGGICLRNNLERGGYDVAALAFYAAVEKFMRIALKE